MGVTTPVSSQLPRIKKSLHLAHSPEQDRLESSHAQCQKSLGISRVMAILHRWQQRAVDLARIKSLLRRDETDLKTFPEVKLDAFVRRSSSLHQDEEDFIKTRRHRISCQGDKYLHTFLGLAEDEIVDPSDVPLIALGGSGGGYRAMYGFAAFISASKEMGLWGCLVWTAGVSGSCWTLAGYYTFAEQSILRLTQHYLAVARELAHPLSLHALDTVARSSQGIYFLLGPLIRKVNSPSRDIGLVVMDLSLANGFFQWMEISPVEIGNTDNRSYIPTWAWGRTFQSGKSINRCSEQSLSLILGQCTSAPAGPVSGYISALLASLPKGTLMSRILLLLNNFARMKRWEKFWGNPIRAGHDPNPFYGHAPEWERQTKIRLMDGGMSNNLPNHVLARPERDADIIISFDTSSDVQTGAATRRMHNFAEDCNIELEDITASFDQPRPRAVADNTEFSAAAVEVERKFLQKYAGVFHGRRQNGHEIYIVYCPLLPNAVRPDFDPSCSDSRQSPLRYPLQYGLCHHYCLVIIAIDEAVPDNHTKSWKG
ncbi:hypothetical protein J7T55_003769 [Diaporthe amygdali]|uniref:uncharacterized protein n=1 Tax=Phomopsis amygdali TaxID=1214568 RepID=UPI0022FEB353|nr:uncharacterized protein J7T55_003769 [Diaporthe amygdali]KAJ0117355.1 hypothetical protein J7T55_003769 [Diaporthe amygdali]